MRTSNSKINLAKFLLILHCDNSRPYIADLKRSDKGERLAIPRVFVGPLQRVRPRNGILGLVLVVLVVLVVPLRSEFIGEL